ncbi:MAG: PHP domain-containing protein [Clostridiales bacterium]|nr:PHP domain-containing protein [Clostridiales bacterium]
MQFKYDFHIHSGLSPCAEKDMTPVDIVGLAKLNGLDMVAIADHNAIGNVEVALKAGEFYGVTVIPAFELQTAEEIHILCLFESFEDLEACYKSIEFLKVKNKPEIYGNQYFYDEDDNIIGEEENLLLMNAKIPSHKVYNLVKEHNGIAIPAHIDRDANSMLQILGTITEEFHVVELSTRATGEWYERYKDYLIIVDSDAHTTDRIGKSVIDLPENSAKALISYLRNYRRGQK